MKTYDARVILEGLYAAHAYIAKTPNCGEAAGVLSELDTSIDLVLELYRDGEGAQPTTEAPVDHANPHSYGKSPTAAEDEHDPLLDEPAHTVRNLLRSIFDDAKTAEVMDQIFDKPKDEPPAHIKAMGEEIARKLGVDPSQLTWTRVG